MRKIVLLGAPGAGKGTVSEILIDKQKLKHISVGDILRDNIEKGTELGILADKYMKNGDLVPNEIIIEVVKNRLSESDCENGYLLDGYPRTIAQAEALDSFSKPNYVFNIDVNREIIIDRLIGRRICKQCGLIYHVSNLKTETCPKCGGDLYQRKDDNIEVVTQRLEVYNIKTKPLIDYYNKEGRLINVDGTQKPIDVYHEIEKYLK